jgi:hypothetical protein
VRSCSCPRASLSSRVLPRRILPPPESTQISHRYLASLPYLASPSLSGGYYPLMCRWFRLDRTPCCVEVIPHHSGRIRVSKGFATLVHRRMPNWLRTGECSAPGPEGGRHVHRLPSLQGGMIRRAAGCAQFVARRSQPSTALSQRRRPRRRRDVRAFLALEGKPLSLLELRAPINATTSTH